MINIRFMEFKLFQNRSPKCPLGSDGPECVDTNYQEITRSKHKYQLEFNQNQDDKQVIEKEY